MSKKDVTIGLVVPFAEDKIPPEGCQMYPDMRFVPRGVGVRSLTPEGYAAAFDAIPAAADHLVAQGVDAIMVIGTSLTFYRGPQAHDRLLERLRASTGLPVSTMSQAIVDGLHAVGAKRVAVATASALSAMMSASLFLLGPPNSAMSKHSSDSTSRPEATSSSVRRWFTTSV